uniref:Venom allergen/ancylostoma secreted protein-like 14 n=1 Tax=Heligmosomoides polygyrus bakeri TaxID=375939 RepID=G4XWY2_HELBE|nr:venom allergen/ancylostoma secreted protein-like 14 [Heligmosomoides bakeri]
MLALVALLLVITKPSSETAFGCNLNDVTDEEREQALSYHNDLRSQLALGSLDYYEASWGPAANMYQLTWSCSLEQTVSNAIQGCPSSPSVPEEYGLNVQIWTLTTPSNFLLESLAVWQSQYADSTPTNVVDSKIPDFAQMINAKTLTVACSKQKCSDTLAIAACIYDQPRLKEGDEIFEEGAACSSNADCTTYTPATCNSTSGLCAVEVSTTTPPTGAAATTTPSSGAGATATPPNAHPNPAINQICPANGHMNDRIRTRALDMINYRRSQLANGLVQKFNGNYLPKAGNMVQLKYDCSLENSADTHAKTCSRTNSNAAADIGETIKNADVSTTVTTRVEGMGEAVKVWWRKIKTETVSIGMAVTFKSQHVNAPIRTFTTLAWATTTRIGCGVEKCNGFFFIVCHYQPRGNIVNSVIYQTGEPCTRCPSGAACATPLCVL